MKAEEKAKELVDRFYDYINFSECYQGSKASAKQCALICVDEITSCEHFYRSKKSVNYWQEVKQKIEKL